MDSLGDVGLRMRGSFGAGEAGCLADDGMVDRSAVAAGRAVR